MTDRLRDIARTLKKTYGQRSSGSADAIQTRIRRLPTGALDLDYATGGGVPVGRATTFFGEFSGGKSSSACRILGLGQGLCRRCLRPAKDVGAVPPSKAVLEEDPQARWSGVGICTCVKEGLVTMEVPGKDSSESAKAYKERLETWREAIELNSYQEFITVWADPEDAFDNAWAEKLGADPKRIFFIRPTTGEEGVDMITALMGSGQVDLTVVDSLAHFIPRKEYEESAENWQQGLQARIVNKGIRKWFSAVLQAKREGFESTQIWINQTRSKIGVMFGDPTVKPAGKGQDFAASVEIKFLKGKEEKIEEQYGSKKEVTVIPIKEQIRFKVTKNKTAATKGVEGSYIQLMRDTDVAKAGSVEEDEYVFKLAMHHLVEKTKTGYKLGDREWTSQKAILVDLREDPALFKNVRDTLLTIMLKAVG